MSDEEVPLDKLAKIYIKIRTARAALEAQDKELKDKQEQIKYAIKDRMLELNVESLRTEQGTLTLTKKVRYSTTDWEAMSKFILDNGLIDLIEKRIAQGNMARFLEENPDKLPPTLNISSEYDVAVRKPT